MVPDSFETFFLATAGVGGAFIGLLFIAISISPKRTFDPRAVAGVHRQRLAEATFLTLFDGFVVSCVALIPGVNVGWMAFVTGGVGTLVAAQLIWFLASAHRHVVPGRAPWLHRLRVISLTIFATLLYAIEGLLGFHLILQPHDDQGVRWLAVIVLCVYTLGMLRAWTLLGDPQHGWSGWLNPLQDLDLDLETTRVTHVAKDASA